jgi:hypothetical protein
MPTRNVEVRKKVNANIEKRKLIDFDQSSPIEEIGTVPDAVKAYVVATEYGDSLVHRTVLTCTAVPLSIADDAGVAQYGGVKLYTFPEGLIFTKGAIISGNLKLGVTGTIIDAFTGVNALGSVTASTGATLVSTEATYLQSTANATAASKVAAISSVSIATALTESSSRIVDGTSTPAPVFLNFAIADDASHTAGTGTFTGTVTISWEKIGDK